MLHLGLFVQGINRLNSPSQ